MKNHNIFVMKSCFYNLAVVFIKAALFVFLNGTQIQGQEKQDYLNLNSIQLKLVFTSRIIETTEEINEQLIKDIKERKVNFILSSEDEESLKKAGASEALIRVIRENLPKEIKEKIVLTNEKVALYRKFTDNYDGNVSQKKIAIDAAKEYVKRYRDDKDDKEIIAYFTKVIPELESIVKSIVNCCGHDLFPIYRKYVKKFDESFKAKKLDDLFKAGAEILKTKPEFVDVTLVLASVGFDNAVSKSNRKYLDQTLYYAEKSIKLLEKEKISQYYGAFEYQYKTKEFPDGKANALGYMNYIIGYIKYFYLKQEDEADLYFQTSLHYKSKSNELVRQLNLPSK